MHARCSLRFIQEIALRWLPRVRPTQAYLLNRLVAAQIVRWTNLTNSWVAFWARVATLCQACVAWKTENYIHPQNKQIKHIPEKWAVLNSTDCSVNASRPTGCEGTTRIDRSFNAPPRKSNIKAVGRTIETLPAVVLKTSLPSSFPMLRTSENNCRLPCGATSTLKVISAIENLAPSMSLVFASGAFSVLKTTRPRTSSTPTTGLCTSEAFLAEILVKSSWKKLTFIIKRYSVDQSTQKYIKYKFEKSFTTLHMWLHLLIQRVS